MKKSILTAALLATCAILPGARTEAHPVEKAQIKVPFAFVAGGQTLPAGNYQIEMLTESKPGQDAVEVVVLRGKDQFGYASFVASLEKGESSSPQMQFRMDSETAVLTSVSVTGKSFRLGPAHDEHENVETAGLYVTVGDAEAGPVKEARAGALLPLRTNGAPEPAERGAKV